MRNHNQAGSGLVWVILSVLMTVLFLSAAGFGFWAFSQRNDYKNNSDAKSAEAVKIAEDNLRAELEKVFIEKEKSPYRVYNGTATFGAVSFSYPKTWSALVDESGKGVNPVIAYLHPGNVPGLTSGVSFAVRMEIIDRPYADVLKSFDSVIKNGKVTARAFVPELLKENSEVVPGVYLDGEIASKKQGSMVLMKVRDKTLKLWTESRDFSGDYNDTILKTLTFSP